MTIHDNPWKSIKIDENRWTALTLQGRWQGCREFCSSPLPPPLLHLQSSSKGKKIDSPSVKFKNDKILKIALFKTSSKDCVNLVAALVEEEGGELVALGVLLLQLLARHCHLREQSNHSQNTREKNFGVPLLQLLVTNHVKQQCNQQGLILHLKDLKVELLCWLQSLCDLFQIALFGLFYNLIPCNCKHQIGRQKDFEKQSN